ncbi:MAG: amidohydrolase [Oscillospiraceae bacterium]|nr:amidohydrolase [Candidatus Equicaccousia limihippi]
MLNGYKIIDNHCHIFPEKIVTAAVAATDRFYGLNSVYDGRIDTLIKSGRDAGVDKFIVCSVATTPKQVRSINGFIAENVAKHSDLLIGLGALHPDTDDLKGDISQIKELGLKGVKLHPDIQRFKIDDYRCLKIYEACEKEGLPILMHTGDNRYDFSNPNRLLPVMKIYTGLTVVGAHLGGYSVYEEAVEKLKDLPNFYVDCSSSFFMLDTKTAKEIILKYGTDKVLFGTDYPLWDYNKELKILFDMELDEEDYRKIFYENSAKLFGI